ncbi:MAG TPA: tetratricopeptide repeat protein [Bryobacteraceae bacterium]|nr:tetratricopeptide repeat protein [Bryobacteraceae bacterium]
MPAISAILMVASAAGILLETAYRNNSAVEAALCRFHICDTGQLIDRVHGRRFELGADAAALGREEALEALRRDSASADRWCDAGESLLLAGDAEKAAYACRRAVELAPDSPPILWAAASFHWRTGRTRDAIALSRHILELVRDYDSVVFLSYARSGLPIDELLGGVPADPAAARRFFEYTVATANTAAARELWQWMESRGYATRPLAARYVDFLLAGRLYAEAAAAWSAYAGGGVHLLRNGGFESEFSGPGIPSCVFDWTPSGAEHVSEERDSTAAREGRWSLRIQFDGTDNLNYQGVSQAAVVTAGAFRLSAWIKVAGITTDRGIAMRVFDPESPSRLDVRTAPLAGTADWVQVHSDFTVPRGTNLVRVQVFREPSWKFDNKIGGTAWIDGVELLRRQ